jgi:hypothetical protein
VSERVTRPLAISSTSSKADRLTAAFELLTGGLPLPHPGNV